MLVIDPDSVIEWQMKSAQHWIWADDQYVPPGATSWMNLKPIKNRATQGAKNDILVHGGVGLP